MLWQHCHFISINADNLSLKMYQFSFRNFHHIPGSKVMGHFRAGAKLELVLDTSAE